MPKVGKKTFGYGSEGKKQASKYAKKHGLKVSKKSNPGYYAESSMGSRINNVLNILREAGQVPEGDPPLPSMSDKDLEHYKGRPSRRRRGTRKSKKTQAAIDRAAAAEATAETATFRRGGRGK